MFQIQRAIGETEEDSQWVGDPDFSLLETEYDAKELLRVLRKWQPKVQRRVRPWTKEEAR